MKNNEMEKKRNIIYKVMDLYYVRYFDKLGEAKSDCVELVSLSEMLVKLDFTTIEDDYDAINQVINDNKSIAYESIVIKRLSEMVDVIELNKEIIDIKNGKIDLKDIRVDKIKEGHLRAKYINILNSSKKDFDLVEKRIKEEIRDYLENLNIYKFYSYCRVLLQYADNERETYRRMHEGNSPNR